MTGQELFAVFKGIRLHFTQNGYDYLTYGPSKVYDSEYCKVFTLAGALTRKFPNRDALEQRLIAIFKHKTVWLNEIVGPDASKFERDHLKTVSNFNEQFELELSLLSDKNPCIMDAFKSNSSLDVPPIARHYLTKQISIETFCALDMLMGFSKGLNSIVWKDSKLRIEKYKSFFNPNLNDVARIAKPYFRGVICKSQSQNQNLDFSSTHGLTSCLRFIHLRQRCWMNSRE